MTVQELIKKLKQLDPNMQVLVWGFDESWVPADEARVQNILRFDMKDEAWVSADLRIMQPKP